MGKLDVKFLGGLGEISDGATEYDNEISEEFLAHRIKCISKALSEHSDKSCYFVCFGAQPYAIFKKVELISDVKLMFSKSLLNFWLKPLSAIVASHAGVIKVTNSMALPKLFELLSGQTMVGVYVFGADQESHFMVKVKENILPEDFSFGVRVDEQYFFYIVDSDNSESKTGIYEVVSYGKNAKYISAYL